MRVGRADAAAAAPGVQQAKGGARAATPLAGAAAAAALSARRAQRAHLGHEAAGVWRLLPRRRRRQQDVGAGLVPGLRAVGGGGGVGGGGRGEGETGKCPATSAQDVAYVLLVRLHLHTGYCEWSWS